MVEDFGGGGDDMILRGYRWGISRRQQNVKGGP